MAVRANAKSRSGQSGGQKPWVASDLVAQQANRYIRAKILLNRAHHIQDDPLQAAHYGGTMARAKRQSSSRNCMHCGQHPARAGRTLAGRARALGKGLRATVLRIKPFVLSEGR